MLRVAGQPILEQCMASGLQEFYLAVNHLKEHIRDYFEDGSRWGVSIQYIEETLPLGTAGALQLLPDEARSGSPLLVMKGMCSPASTLPSCWSFTPVMVLRPLCASAAMK